MTKYVDMDASVEVQSGINVEPQDSEDLVLEAAATFMKHPNRALSAAEVGVLMGREIDNIPLDVVETSDYLDRLEEAGVLYVTNERDGELLRYRINSGITDISK